jgi:Zn-dependent protease
MGMRGSWKLGTIAGIGVYIHWTFWLLMLFYTLSAAAAGGWSEGLFTGLLVASVFACVLAHEFGHALAAASFGIPTHDITLLPIGGLARLARIPQKPSQELVIALAGPLVNVLIAAILIVALPLLDLPALSDARWAIVSGGLIENIIAANIVLVLFNMLPAFPMDGGRVLRSLIAMRTTHLRATEIAARVGRWMSLLFVVAAIAYGNLSLMLVGIFVFLSGSGELMEARRRAMAASAGGFRWGWSTVEPLNQTTNPYAPQNPFGRNPGPSGSWSSNSNHSDEIVDAVEVREIK